MQIFEGRNDKDMVYIYNSLAILVDRHFVPKWNISHLFMFLADENV